MRYNIRGDIMAEKKHSAFALLEILTTYTDEDHILTAKQIMELLETKYQLKIERRTLYSNVEILEQAGYVISKYDDNGKGYFLEQKQFDKAEILLLCNAIHASHFISREQSNKLIKKLLATQSKYEAKEFMGDIYLPSEVKTANRELLYNIETISDAVRDNKMMQFSYMKYNENKKLVPRRADPYIVEPRYIVYDESRAYLIATHPKYQDFVHYRLDRISKAVLIEQQCKKLPKDMDPYEYARNKLFMYTGEIVPVRFLCKESVLDQMIDIFGRDVHLAKREDGDYILTTSTSRTGAKYLAQQFLDSLEILEPIDLREEFKEELKKALAAYENNEETE
mgnify:FL=1